LAVLADPLVPWLLTEKWRPSVSFLRILSIAGILYPIHSLYLVTLTAQGAAHLTLRLTLIKFIITVLSVMVVYRFGVIALAWNMVAVTILSYFINVYYHVRILQYDWRMQAYDIVPVFLICGAAALASIGAAALLPFGDPVAQIALKVGVFSSLLVIGVLVFHKTYFAEVWLQLLSLARNVRLANWGNR
jgi:O-antigen/teichoic acid export membrane protein